MLVRLSSDAAEDASLTGAKAASLATATRLGLPVLPGLVLTTHGAGHVAELREPLRDAWVVLTEDGRLPLAVRSSSTIEDGASSSMAGVFTSVLDVTGWPALIDALDLVLGSSGDHPMAVLLQPMLDASLGGVLFGLDPVTGREDRLLVESIPEGPAALVSGLRSGTRHVLSRRGRLIESDDGRTSRSLNWRRRHALAAIARETQRVFGAPQDVEWAFDRGGHLWLLQSRPVTAAAAPVPSSGPVLGPGPVAETLPDALTPLEEDLWVGPMRGGIDGALRVIGVSPARKLSSSPILLTVGGRVAADLELLGISTGAPSLFERLDPRPPARRLAAAWRVGRLGRALPSLAEDLIVQLDHDLAAVPAVAAMPERQALDLLHQVKASLLAVHGHEVLAGLVGVHGGASATAAALTAVARGRAAGEADAEIIASAPVTLALSAPAIGRSPSLPANGAGPVDAAGIDELGAREALRLRARWLHELSARAATALGHRLHERASISSPGLVRWLRLDELDAIVDGGAAPQDLAARAMVAPGPPLPTSFRLAADGTPVAIAARGGRRLAGRGAGGGRGMGKVRQTVGEPVPPGMVLVVRTLEPGLAGVLPGAGGLVAETGSVLSHLAILARELGVPTVVGVADALARFPEGSTVVVDGSTGEVSRLEAEAVR